MNKQFAREHYAHQAAIAKAITGVIQIHDETVIIVDADRLEREVLKGSIADSDVQKLLPFHTTLGMGRTYKHIVNASAYTIQTDRHFIREGATLCAKDGPIYFCGAAMIPTCPGCLAKGKSLIVQHLLN